MTLIEDKIDRLRRDAADIENRMLVIECTGGITFTDLDLLNIRRSIENAMADVKRICDRRRLDERMKEPEPTVGETMP